MAQVDVLYEQTGRLLVRYYPQTPEARRFFGPFQPENGSFPFAEEMPDLKWLEDAGLTHAPHTGDYPLEGDVADDE